MNKRILIIIGGAAAVLGTLCAGCFLFSLIFPTSKDEAPQLLQSPAARVEAPAWKTAAPTPLPPTPTLIPLPPTNTPPPPSSTPAPIPPPPTDTPVPPPAPTPTPIPPPPTDTSVPPPAPTPTPIPPPPTDTPPPPAEAQITIFTVNKDDEYVDIQNIGGAPQDLTGWRLLSETGGQDCLLAGTIQPGETLRIWAMAKDTDKGGYNCGFDGPIWNNKESDPAVLFDATGCEIDRK